MHASSIWLLAAALVSDVDVVPDLGANAPRLVEVRKWAEEAPAKNKQLVDALQDPDVRVGMLARRALHVQGEAAVPSLVERLAAVTWDYGMGSVACGDPPVLNPKDVRRSISMTLVLALVNNLPLEKLLETTDELTRHPSGRVRHAALYALGRARTRGLTHEARTAPLYKLLDDPYPPLREFVYKKLGEEMKAERAAAEFEKRFVAATGKGRRELLFALPSWLKQTGKYELALSKLIAWTMADDESLSSFAAESLHALYDPREADLNAKLLDPLREQWAAALTRGDVTPLKPWVECNDYLVRHPATGDELKALAAAVGKLKHGEQVARFAGVHLDRSVPEAVRGQAWRLLVSLLEQKHDDKLALAAADEIWFHDTGRESLKRALSMGFQADATPQWKLPASKQERKPVMLAREWHAEAAIKIAARFRDWRPPVTTRMRDWEIAFHLNLKYFGKEEAAAFFVDFGKFVAQLPDERSNHRDEERFLRHIYFCKDALGLQATFPVYFDYLRSRRTGAKDRLVFVTEVCLKDKSLAEDKRNELSRYLLDRIADPTEDPRFRATITQAVKATGHAAEKFVPVVRQVVEGEVESNLLAKSLGYLVGRRGVDPKLTPAFFGEQFYRLVRDPEIPEWVYQHNLDVLQKCGLPKREYVDLMIRCLEDVPRNKYAGVGLIGTSSRVTWGSYPVVDARSQFVLPALQKASGTNHGLDAKAWREWYRTKYPEK